ncbi:S-adenosyl-L-methionine-dependent methyltransferase [Xylaria acuta]|nr:S-adenosyl-L-methionine-dependent methyltransferase [Xylaria acuta]
MSDMYTDNMTRGSSEIERLEDQFEVFTQNIGYLLHPSITSLLPPAPRIADVGTGTGAFLRLLSPMFPDATLHGFDISAALFPPEATLPPNLSLMVGDLKQPFPEAMHGTYDVVHARLLVAAMLPDDWEPAVRNLSALLKPGGFLQWDECDFINSRHIRGRVDSRVESATAMGDAFREAMRERFEHGWNDIPECMRAAGLTSVISDTVSSDRVSETRERLTISIQRLVFTWARLMAERGAPGSMTSDQLDLMEKDVEEDIKSGCYFRFDIHVACGRKPLH